MNYGLVELCLEALPSRAILQLQKVYKTISLQEVAEFVHLPHSITGTLGNEQPTQVQKVEYITSVINHLIAEKKLAATIAGGDSETQYLEFTTPKTTSQESAEQLTMALHRLKQTAYHFQQMDAQMSISRDFLTKAYGAASRTTAGAAPIDPMTGGMADEDLMSGPGGQPLEFWEE